MAVQNAERPMVSEWRWGDDPIGDSDRSIAVFQVGKMEISLVELNDTPCEMGD